MPSEINIKATRAYVEFTLPKQRVPLRAVIDTGAEANVLGMNHLSEGNLEKYLRPYYAELHPIGEKLISSSFKVNIPVKFATDSNSYLVDFIVLEHTQHIILGQPWLRNMELCLDMGYSKPGVNSLKTSSFT